MPSLGLTISYHLIKWLIRGAMLLLTRTTVRGIELVPRHGPGIVVCNHISAVDPAILVGVLPRPIVLMSKAENDRGILKLFLALVGAFTVRRGKADRRALWMAQRTLAGGRLLGIFPEGTRHQDGLGAAHGGAVLLALKTGAPIIPVALTGTAHVFSRRFPWLGFPEMTVTIGAPFFLRAPKGTLRRSDRQRMTDELMIQIAALLPPEFRGAYRQAA